MSIETGGCGFGETGEGKHCRAFVAKSVVGVRDQFAYGGKKGDIAGMGRGNQFFPLQPPRWVKYG